MGVNVFISIITITIAHCTTIASSRITYFLHTMFLLAIIHYSHHPTNKFLRFLSKVMRFLPFLYAILLLFASTLCKNNIVGNYTLLSIIELFYSPIRNACIITAIYQSKLRGTYRFHTQRKPECCSVHSINLFPRYTTLQRSISSLSTCSEKAGSTFSPKTSELHHCAINTALCYGLLLYNRTRMSITYINEVASSIVLSFSGITSLMSSLINKKTKSTLENDITSNIGADQTPTNSAYYTQNAFKCMETYYIRFVYIPSTDSIALSIYNDNKKPYNTHQISSTLKEITSCSLFHELINLVNGIYTNVELLNEETDKCFDNTDSYKVAIMFINVLTLRLRDIDDFTSMSFNKFRLHYSQFQLYSLLIKYKEIIGNFAKIKGSQVNILISKEVPTYITSDQSRILQVIVNCAYAILEKVEFCSLDTEAKIVAFDYIDIIIRLTTNEKNKIEEMFNSINSYQIPQCNSSTSIKNIEGLPLISTFYISKRLGKEIEVKKTAKNIFEMHVYIKNGFIDQSIESTSIKDECMNPKSVKSKARQLQLSHLKKASSSVEYLLNFKRLNSPMKLNLAKCDDISSNCDIPIPIEREPSEIKLLGQMPPLHFKDLLCNVSPICQYERRSKKNIQYYNINSLSKIHSDDPEYNAIIADDNFVNIMVLKSLLKLIKVNVMCTKDGLECVNAVKQLVSKGQFHKIKIIFMDMQMPIMDGIEATKEILRFLDASNVKKPPIIGISSDNNEEDRNKFFVAGISEFVRKPVSKSVVSDIYVKHVVP